MTKIWYANSSAAFTAKAAALRTLFLSTSFVKCKKGYFVEKVVIISETTMVLIFYTF